MSVVSFNSLNNIKSDASERELIDRLFLLREELEFALTSLDESNFTKKFYENLEVTIIESATIKVLSGLDISGIVTFEALASGEETIINGAHIKTGTIEASTFITHTYENNPTSPDGEVLMYYVTEYGTKFLGGGLRLDGEGEGTDTSSRYRLHLYTKQFASSLFKPSLKLRSENNINFSADEQIYIACLAPVGSAVSVLNITPTKIVHKVDDVETITIECDSNGDNPNITLNAYLLEINGTLLVNGKEVVL